MTSCKTIFVFLLAYLLSSCDGKSNLKRSTLFEKQSAAKSNIDFVNTVENTSDFNIFTYRNFYNGGGVAIGDVNNDGLADIFLTSNMGSNKLYLNNGGFSFEDITEKAGVGDENKWSTGVSFVDLNHDGFLDIYVCNAGYEKGSEQNNTLYINNQDLTFTESAAKWGLDESGYTTHVSFFDYDRDGDLDAYILNNSFIPVNTLNYSNKRELRAKDWPVKEFLKGGGDKLLRNEGDSFVDVSEEAGVYGSLIGFGLGVTVGDVNGDDWPDIYVSNDFFERDYLYINQQNGKFSEQLTNYIDHISHSSMGADMADINNDGKADIFVTDMLPLDPKRKKKNASFDDINLFKLKTSNGFYNQYMHNTLQLNSSKQHFKEISNFANVAASDWSWGALMFDMDNDSNTDIFVCNGIYKDVVDLDFIDFFANDIMTKMALSGKKEDLNSLIDKMPSTPIANNVFQNNGDLTFTEATEKWGFGEKTFSNGSAYGDLDNDGDLDLVVNNVNQQAQVFKNKSVANYLRVKLKGIDENSFAIGAKISLFVEGKTIFRELIPSRGFQSSIDYVSVFGLGEYTKVDSLVVTWPDGVKSRHKIKDINTEVVLDRSSVKNIWQASSINSTSNNIFTELKSNFNKHTENEFIDFYFERNIPSMFSQEGPNMAVADVNGDNKEDVFIGGASGQLGHLYLSNKNGFVEKKIGVLQSFIAYEDTAIHFFDADGDGDVDLLIGSGGNEFDQNSAKIQDRLLLNDGKANFTWKKDALPSNKMNTSKIVSYDFDKDGKLDLFIGNLSRTATYGVSPISLVYKNMGEGRFANVKIPKSLSLAGMIKDAIWADVYGDKEKELILVGEWMSPSIFEFKNNEFSKVNSSLAKFSGFWNSVNSADLDGDGDQDLVLGNIGKNVPYDVGEDKPLRIFVSDFDKNGEYDKIITYSENGKNYPVFAKRELAEQLPELKKQNLMHKDYASKSIMELLSEEKVKSASRKGVNYLSSCIAYNEGNGDFRIAELPAEVQLSCVNAILPLDVEGDGDLDIVLGGNNYDFLPQFSRLDASRGHVLINDGKGNMSLKEDSGFNVVGEVQDIVLVKKEDHNQIVVAVNNKKPKLFNLQK